MLYLNKIMAEKGITQKELCAITGISKSSISQYVSGRVIPSKDRLVKIAAALNIEVAELYMDHPKSPKSAITVDQAAEMIGVSSPWLRAALQQGSAPFGFAVHGEKKWSYHISPHLLRQYVGDDVFDKFMRGELHEK